MRTAAVLLAAAAVAATTGWAASPRPSLRLVDANPVVLTGSGFKQFERVQLIVRSSDRRFVRSLRATAAGTFRATFPAVVHDPCANPVSAVATGASGSRATLKLILRVCPPA